MKVFMFIELYETNIKNEYYVKVLMFVEFYETDIKNNVV